MGLPNMSLPKLMTLLIIVSSVVISITKCHFKNANIDFFVRSLAPIFYSTIFEKLNVSHITQYFTASENHVFKAISMQQENV